MCYSLHVAVKVSINCSFFTFITRMNAYREFVSSICDNSQEAQRMDHLGYIGQSPPTTR